MAQPQNPNRQGQRPQQHRPPQQRQNNRNGASLQAQPQQQRAVKMKPPVTKGGATIISLIVAFIMLLIFAGGLVFVAMSRSASEQATYAQTLSDSINKVQDAAVDVAFTPAESIRKQMTDPNANITSVKDDNGTKKTVYGAGVVISTNNTTSYILTNYHVVEGNQQIKVKISDTEYDADLLGWDTSSDLAILTIQAKGLPVAKIGKSANVKQGDYTASVGNPYGLNDTMTTGIISALDRNFTMKTSAGNTVIYADMFQTDAPISPGNSGGGLYNAVGELIGINTLVSGADDSHADSFGYAIPIDLAVPIAQNLMAEKAPAHPSLGVSVSDVDKDTVAKYGLQNSDGALIVNITPSGPAETTGIIKGDIITSFGGEKVANAQDLLFKIRASVINEQKEIKVLREGKEMTFQIKVGSDA